MERQTGWDGDLRATVDVLEVIMEGTRGLEGRIIVKGPGQNFEVRVVKVWRREVGAEMRGSADEGEATWTV